MSATADTIREEMRKVLMINTHDHIAPQKQIQDIAKDDSYLYDLMLVNNNSGLLSYLPDEVWRTAQFDFGDAMGKKEQKASTSKDDLAKMWKKLSPLMRHARGSCHYRMFMRACRDLFNIDFDYIATEKNFIELSEKLAKSNRDESWYRHVLKEKALIEKTIVIGRSDPDEIEKEFFKAAINLQDFLSGYDELKLKTLEKTYGMKADDLDAYVAMLDKAFATISKKGAIAIKDALAYARPLQIRDVPIKEARKAFQPIQHNGWAWKSIDSEDIRNFQDFMMNQIAEKASQYHMPVQIHTGPPAPGENGNPMYLLNFIESHPETTFVILHAGGPWADQFAVFAKFCANVYIDFAWLLTGFPGPSGTKRLIGDWLEIMPWNKFTWGMDCAVVEETYGTLATAREVLAEVLVQKVGEGLFDGATAIEVGKGILRDNAKEIYKGI